MNEWVQRLDFRCYRTTRLETFAPKMHHAPPVVLARALYDNQLHLLDSTLILPSHSIATLPQLHGSSSLLGPTIILVTTDMTLPLVANDSCAYEGPNLWSEAKCVL